MAGKLFKNRILENSSVGISNHPGVEKHSSEHYLNDSKLNFSIFGPESENRPFGRLCSDFGSQLSRGSQIHMVFQGHHQFTDQTTPGFIF